MHGEERVVGLRSHDGAAGRDQLDAQKQSQQHPGQEKTEGAVKIEQADALVVGGKDPGGDAAPAGIVPEAGLRWLCVGHHTSGRGAVLYFQKRRITQSVAHKQTFLA